MRFPIPFAAFAALLGACAQHPMPAAEAGPTEEVAAPMATHVHHSIDYIEFTVTDMTAAKAFYGAAFGWEFTDYGPDYAGIKKEDGEAGGLRLDSEVSPGGPLVILHSADLESTLAAVRAAGGVITAEPFDFPGGRRFHFSDPSGNQLAVWGFPADAN